MPTPLGSVASASNARLRSRGYTVTGLDVAPGADKQMFIDVNVTGTLNLLEAPTAAGHDCFVFTSTTSTLHPEVGCE